MDYGVYQEIEVGPISVKKLMYMPTIERFNKWVDIVEKQPWFEGFSCIITGSFPNQIRRDSNIWPTWDIDIILVSDNMKNLTQIRTALVNCVNVALNECDFFMDIYYEKNRYTPELNKVLENRDEQFYYNGLEGVKTPRFNKLVINFANEIKKNGKVVTRWGKGQKLIENLYGRRLWFPSTKQVGRIRKKQLYSRPIFLEEYKEKYYKQITQI